MGTRLTLSTGILEEEEPLPRFPKRPKQGKLGIPDNYRIYTSSER